MKANNFITSLALIICLFSVSAWGQPKHQTTTAKPPAPTLLNQLPPSDALALVNVRQLLTEAMPRMLANNAAKLAEANVEIDKFKTRTGIDPRAFDQVAVGMVYMYPQPEVTKIESVVLGRGTFKTEALVAAGQKLGSGAYREETYRGNTIYIFSIKEQMKLFGLVSFKVNELAVTALTNNVLCLSSPTHIKFVLDAIKGSSKGRGDANRELIELATRDANAAIGFGGKVTPELLRTINIGNEAIAKDLSSVRQVYGTVGVTAKDVEMFLAARTLNPESAKGLGSTLEGLKQLGAFLVSRMPAPKGTLARTALDNLRITTQGNELQIRTAIAQADIAPLLRGE